MAKGEQTRQTILQQAAEVFNVHGYAGTSMDALTQATRLTKGGIYNHFSSKEALALAAFDHAFARVQQRFLALYTERNTTRGRLRTYFRLFESYLQEQPILTGGCPVLNTAIEADDTDSPLRERARAAGAQSLDHIARTVAKGIERGDVRPGTDPRQVATVLYGTLEGALMLTKLYGDGAHLRHAIDHLETYLDTFITE